MPAAPVDQMADDRRAAGWLHVRTTPRANINSLHRSSRARMRTLQAGFRAHCKKTIDCLFVKRAVVGALRRSVKNLESVFKQRRSRT